MSALARFERFVNFMEWVAPHAHSGKWGSSGRWFMEEPRLYLWGQLTPVRDPGPRRWLLDRFLAVQGGKGA